ncbi:MAG: 50S ribosomal protein L30 [Thiobacillaceae bacterium]
MADAKKIKVTLIKSLIGTKAPHRMCVKGLGLRRLHHSVELQDTPAIRGLINMVSYMVKVES